MVFSTQKDEQIERMRVLACVLVVMVHISNYYIKNSELLSTLDYQISIAFNIIARTAVPIFIMITGALIFQKPYNREKNQKKILHFLMILVVWNFVYILWNGIYLKRESVFSTSIITYVFSPSKNHLWYLYILLGIYIALPFESIMVNQMDRKLENRFIILWLIFGCGGRTLPLLLKQLDIDVSLQYQIPIIQGTYQLGYLIIGHILYQRKEEFVSKTKIGAFLSIAVSILCLILSIYIFRISDGNTVLKFLTYGNIFIAIIAISLFVLNMQVPASSHGVITLLSSLSFGIYLIHPVFIDVITQVFYVLNDAVCIAYPMIFIAVFMASATCIWILKHIKFVSKIVS